MGTLSVKEKKFEAVAVSCKYPYLTTQQTQASDKSLPGNSHMHVSSYSYDIELHQS